jgi:hypothetical protein
MIEMWKDIKGYEGLYQVSNFGRVRSLDHIIITKCGNSMLIKGRMKKPTSDSNGYMVVNLQSRESKKLFKVHRLVAQAFIPNENCKPEVNHKDGKHDNNCVSNLEWCTSEENIKHALDNGLIASKGIAVIMDNCIVFDSITKCAKYLGVDKHEIRRALQGKYKTVHGHTFKKCCG